MNIYIFCRYRDYFSKVQMRELKKAAHIILIEDVGPIGKNKALIHDTHEKMITIDPDSCHWRITNEDVDRIPNLKAIILNSTSFDYIDVNHCRQKNIIVTNTRNFASEAVAEWLLMMSLMIARKMPLIIQNDWKLDFQQHMGMELQGKTAGIIGLGNVGKRIAQLCNALGMKVLYWSPHSHDGAYKRVGLKKLFRTADFIYPCLAKNPETMELITKKHLLSMKKNACLVAASPQCQLLDNNTVYKRITSKKMYGIGFEHDRDSEQFYHKENGNILITPAIAWYTKETTLRNAEKWTRNIIEAARMRYPNKVN